MTPCDSDLFSGPGKASGAAIGLGCVTFGREIDSDMSWRILDHAYVRGIRLFDTAEKYGEGASEAILGEWLQSHRGADGVVVATKASAPLSRENIQRSVAGSLRRLRTNAIDLYQLHTWDPQTPLEETLAALDEQVRNGSIRAVGVSNFSAWQVCRALWLQDRHGYRPLASVQPIYNLSQRGAEKELFPCCTALGVSILSYSPLGAGFLTGKYSREGAVPAGSRFDLRAGHKNTYFNEESYLAVDQLRQTSNERGIEMAQLALSWVFRQPEVTTVLVGARNSGQVDQAFEARARAFDPERQLPGVSGRP